MDRKNYKYSIIMPVFNAEKSLDKSICSILNQTYSNWELIIVNDGSTDHSMEKIKKYLNDDSRIKYFYKENQGPGIARNFGIKQTTGDYVAFLDADDYYEESFLENVNEKNQKKEYDLLFINVVNENKFGKVIHKDDLTKYSSYDKKKLLGMQIAGILPWGAVYKVVKTNIIKQCEFANIDVGEEAIFSYNLLLLSTDYTFIKKTMYHYVHTEIGQHKKGGYEPWKPVLDCIQKKLIESNCYNEYKEYVECLALKSLSIFIYRYSSKNSIFKSIKEIKNKKNEYEMKYCLKNISKNVLEKSTKFIFTLLNLNMYFSLVIVSKLRSKLKNMEG